MYDESHETKVWRPRKNWFETVHQDPKGINMDCEEVQQFAGDREEWCQSAAQCVFYMGWTQILGQLSWVVNSVLGKSKFLWFILYFINKNFAAKKHINLFLATQVVKK